ncbi:DEAD-domain-containing protein [Neolentinus lepideus HHB14362 ss-1]|uniref:ATP-dependent RNA helicase n=1 Tax=Neolentinus lepideus HHB14362 ss-1 TaxID=1314782 RepID=A0A165UDN9_9AGAM|nr:DEAD-domain-containing protein [Neolentinus lepideus HHB14362 ss-1]
MVLSSWLATGRACSRSWLQSYSALSCSRAGISAQRWQSTATAVQEKVTSSEYAPTTPPKDEPLAFETLRGGIHSSTLRALTAAPFNLKTMTAVQAAVLPLAPRLALHHEKAGDIPRDLLVRAKTGTGKTLAFLVPALERRLQAIQEKTTHVIRDQGHRDDKQNRARISRLIARTEGGVLVISPTRELAQQIAVEAQRLTQHHDNIEVRLFVGGEPRGRQLRDWMKGTRDIIVATPGRLRDLLENEPDIKKGLEKVHTLVLDECDTLLDMGFRDDLDAITDILPPPPERQTFLFSATMNRAVRQTAERVLSKNFTTIDTVGDDDSPVHAHIPQYHTILPSAAEQIPHLARLIAHDQLVNAGKSKVILFCSTTKLTALLFDAIKALKRNFPVKDTAVYEIHSKKDQHVRTRTSDKFRQDKSAGSVLVTSDVSARGVDYPGVTRVIQLGIPSTSEQYIHRVGRTGRAGSSGRGDLVLLPWEVGFVSWQLTHISLKPVTTSELESQVTELAEKFDANPALAKGAKGRLSDYEIPVADAVKAIPEAVQKMTLKMDETDIEQAFSSMLGFYATRDGDLRISKNVILEGLKDWVTSACGLPTPPYLSENFLAKVGFGQQNRGKFSMASISKGYNRLRRDTATFSRGGTPPPREEKFRERPKQPWLGRGTVRKRKERDW